MSIKPVIKDGPGDEYYTPDYIVEMLVPYLKQNKNIHTIWCPCDLESSEYVKVFRKNGFIVHNTHIDLGQDFLTYKPDFDFDCIITNPPFSLKNEIIEKCIEYNKPWAILLSLTCLQSSSLVKILSKQDINFILFDRRISYDGDRPPFPSWYFTHKLLDSNKFYIYKEDPRLLYNQWQQHIGRDTINKNTDAEAKDTNLTDKSIFQKANLFDSLV